MNKQSGFTLIELVAVIVLLGVLAVTALPRFVDLRGDARAGVLESVVASMQSASVQIYAKALMQDSLGGNDTVRDGENPDGSPRLVATAFGYPAANDGTNEDIENLITIDGDDSLIFQNGGGNVRRVGYNADGDGRVDDDGCYITYTESTAPGTLPNIEITDDTGC
jgi:MSHA pilin protein MshA